MPASRLFDYGGIPSGESIGIGATVTALVIVCLFNLMYIYSDFLGSEK